MKSESKRKVKSRFLRQRINFAANPKKVFESLLDSRKHSAFTGSKAVISKKPGSSFSVYGGYAKGTVLEAVPFKKIVMTWRSSDFPKEHFSRITMSIFSWRKGTRISFYQSYVPLSQYKAIKQGWFEHYWNKLGAYLEK
ncbi:MAG: hypothetical protein A3G23_07430 [Bacteroidetes bacterium RIFCSPLOWO2_12_FULL_37_12]|nr:MAG: hypothetical protein A3G23_07430 [Bacteroidetes bacterium RIFCSPLOWO2_12_FULL_37_12]